MLIHIMHERPMGTVKAMLAWCRANRLPLIHTWIEPVLNLDGDHVADDVHSMGTRGLFGHYADRSGSDPYPDDEEFVINLYVRDRDYDLWKLRFS